MRDSEGHCRTQQLLWPEVIDAEVTAAHAARQRKIERLHARHR
jgi:hypothetical protein